MTLLAPDGALAPYPPRNIQAMVKRPTNLALVLSLLDTAKEVLRAAEEKVGGARRCAPHAPGWSAAGASAGAPRGVRAGRKGGAAGERGGEDAERLFDHGPGQDRAAGGRKEGGVGGGTREPRGRPGLRAWEGR